MERVKEDIVNICFNGKELSDIKLQDLSDEEYQFVGKKLAEIYKVSESWIGLIFMVRVSIRMTVLEAYDVADKTINSRKGEKRNENSI